MWLNFLLAPVICAFQFQVFIWCVVFRNTAQLLGADSVQAAGAGHKGSVREDEKVDERNGRTETEDAVRLPLLDASSHLFPLGKSKDTYI